MLVTGMYGPQIAAYIGQLHYVTLTCGVLRRRQTPTLFHTSNDDLRMAVHGDDFESLSDDDGFKHIDKSKYAAKDSGTPGIEESDVKSLLLLNRVLRVGTDQTEPYLDFQPDLRHAPLIINESRCTANTRTVNTPREKIQDKLETVERVRF